MLQRLPLSPPTHQYCVLRLLLGCRLYKTKLKPTATSHVRKQLSRVVVG
jgi:hypothetical protein